jgi:hypothetical protein
LSVCKQICLQTPAGRAGGSGACGRRPRRGARAAAAVGPSRTRGAAQRDPADPDCSGTDSELRRVSSSQHGAKGPDRARRLLPRRRPAPRPFRAGGDGAGAGPAGGAVLLATPVPSPALAPLLPLGPTIALDSQVLVFTIYSDKFVGFRVKGETNPNLIPKLDLLPKKLSTNLLDAFISIIQKLINGYDTMSKSPGRLAPSPDAGSLLLLLMIMKLVCVSKSREFLIHQR